jgi:hypothetical protein
LCGFFGDEWFLGGLLELLLVLILVLGVVLILVLGLGLGVLSQYLGGYL